MYYSNEFIICNIHMCIESNSNFQSPREIATDLDSITLNYVYLVSYNKFLLLIMLIK